MEAQSFRDKVLSGKRAASKRAQELWREQLLVQEDEEEVEIEENDEEWLTNQEAAKVAKRAHKEVTRRAMAWLRTDEPRRPLGCWAKGKVWSDIAEMYV